MTRTTKRSETASIVALVEKRFRLAAEMDEAVKGLAHDDTTLDKIVESMTKTLDVLDLKIVDRVAETPADLAAQLRLYHELLEMRWADNRDDRLFKSLMAGVAALDTGHAPPTDGAAGDSVTAAAAAAAATEDDAERKAAHDRYAVDVFRAISLRLFGRYEEACRKAEFHGADASERLGPPAGEGQVALGEKYRRAVDQFLFEEVDTGFAAEAAVKFIGVIAADRLMGEIGDGSGNFEALDMLHILLATSQVAGWMIEPVNKEWLTRRRALLGGSQP